MSEKWKHSGGSLSFGSFTCQVRDNGSLDLSSPVKLNEGFAKLTTEAHISLVSDEINLKLTILGGSKFKIQFSPFIPLSSEDERLVTWTLTSDVDGKIPAEIELELTAEADVDVELRGAGSFLNILLSNCKGIENLGSDFLRSTVFDLPLLRDLDIGNDVLGGLKIELGKPQYSDSDKLLTFSDTKICFEVSESLVILVSKFQIGIDDMAIKVEGLKATITDDIPLLVGDDKPLTLILRSGSQINLGLCIESPELTISRVDEGAAMTIVVPGVSQEDAVSSGTREDRLVFDILQAPNGDDPEKKVPAVYLGPNGLQAEAKLRMRPLGLGGKLENIQLTEGRLTFMDSMFDAEVKATAKLPYFSDSEGSLTIRTSSARSFSAVWEMAAGKSWADPTGNFIVHNPRAAVAINYKDSKWNVTGKVGGQLHFIGVEKLEGTAREWLAGFADMLRMEFEDLDILDLSNVEKMLSGIRLNLSGLPGSLDLWDIFQFRLDSFSLLKNGFDLGGFVSLKEIAGGLSFEGRLPSLRCVFEDGKFRLDVAGDKQLRFSGKLTTPAGVSASLDLQQRSEGRVDELTGAGALSIPSFPAIAITCALGQRRSTDKKRRDPVFLLFVRADYAVPLFPGVVLRNIGLGMGINKVMKVVDEKPHDQVVSHLVNGPAGWPDPAEQSTWTTPERDGFDLSLIADTYIAPSEGSQDQTFPYVGAATLYARPTTDFVILLGASLWLMTNLEDAKKPEFRKDPAAIGAMALFPRHGFLELQVRTRPNPKMTDEIELIKTAMKVSSGEIYLKATRDEFLFRVGPMQSKATFGLIAVSGSVVFATYVGNKGAIAVIQGNLEGSATAKAEVRLRFGPITVTAGFYLNAELAFETVMAGMYVKELGGMALYQRVRAYASVSLEVRIKIEFRLVIRFWRFKKTISWSKSHSASLKLSIDLWVEVLVARQPALHGEAKITVSLFGYDFSPRVEIGKGSEQLNVARNVLKDVLITKRDALNA